MDINAAQSFNFLPVPTDIHFGCGILRTLPERLKAAGGSNAFLVTDPGVRAAAARTFAVTRAAPDARIVAVAVDLRASPDVSVRIDAVWNSLFRIELVRIDDVRRSAWR